MLYTVTLSLSIDAENEQEAFEVLAKQIKADNYDGDSMEIEEEDHST